MALKIRIAVFLIMIGVGTPKSRVRYLLVRIINFLYNEILLSIEIETGTSIGTGLKIYHGYGIVINKRSVIGKNCVLRNGVVVGNKLLKDGSESESPIVGDNVQFGANSIVIGNVRVGDDVVIGAGAVVVSDVPSGSIVVGNPARIIDRK